MAKVDYTEQKRFIKSCQLLGKTPTQTFRLLRSSYGVSSMCRSKSFQWFARFKKGEEPPIDRLRFNTDLSASAPSLASTPKPPLEQPCAEHLSGSGRTSAFPYLEGVGTAVTKPTNLSQFSTYYRSGNPVSPPVTPDDYSDLPVSRGAFASPSGYGKIPEGAFDCDYSSIQEVINGDLQPRHPRSFSNRSVVNEGDKFGSRKNVFSFDENYCRRVVARQSPYSILNRMHVMDGDCAKSDIVAEKAPELDLPPATATTETTINNHNGDVTPVQKTGKKETARDKIVEKKEETKEASSDKPVTKAENGETNGEVLNDSAKCKTPLVNGSAAVSDESSEHSETKCADDMVEEMEEEEIDEGVGGGGGTEEELLLESAASTTESEIPLTTTVSEDETAKCTEEPQDQEEAGLKDEVSNKQTEAGENLVIKEEQTGEIAKVKEEGSAACSEDDERNSVSSSQNRKRRSAEREREQENGEHEVDGEVEGEGSSSDSEGGTKRPRVEVEAEDERERLVREYVERCTQSVEEMSRSADKLQREIGALGELARAKELEWNSILRLRKLKEEMLERLLRRRRQAMMLTDNGLSQEWAADFSKPKVNKNSNNQLMMVPIVSSSPGNITSSVSTGMNRPILSPDTSRLGRLQRPILPKPSACHSNSLLDQQNTVIGEGRQGPILDVKSIIADYRSRHPDNIPRRGRRMKSPMVSSTRISGSPALMSMANMALCSGAHIRNNSQDCNSVQDNSRPSSTESQRSSHQPADLPAPGLSFKDVLVQFAKLNQPPPPTSLAPVKQPPPPPPPYPEVTLHPVPAPHSPPPTHSSLLHGILTKTTATPTSSSGISNNHRPTTFSPTLARLLTAPERERATIPSPSLFRPPTSRVSISDLLTSSKKTRNEITITPVSSQSHLKSKDEVVLLDDDEETDSADRLVIDEGGVERERESGNGDVNSDEVPECQGCHQRAAQFVCAGCGNQWYCSRECQVTAWEEHSEMCSG